MSLRLSEYRTAIFDDVKSGYITRIEDRKNEVLLSIVDVTGKNLYRCKNSFDEVFDVCCDNKDLVCRALWEGQE